MEAAELFRQHCFRGFSGQGTFRRLEEIKTKIHFTRSFSHTRSSREKPWGRRTVLYYSANVLHPVKFGCGQWTSD